MTSSAQSAPDVNRGWCSPRVRNVARGVILSGTILSNFVHSYFSISGYLTAVTANQLYIQTCANITTTAACTAFSSILDSSPVKTLIWDLGTIGLNFAAGFAFSRLCDAGCWPQKQDGRALASLRGVVTYHPVPQGEGGGGNVQELG